MGNRMLGSTPLRRRTDPGWIRFHAWAWRIRRTSAAFGTPEPRPSDARHGPRRHGLVLPVLWSIIPVSALSSCLASLEKRKAKRVSRVRDPNRLGEGRPVLGVLKRLSENVWLWTLVPVVRVRDAGPQANGVGGPRPRVSAWRGPPALPGLPAVARSRPTAQGPGRGPCGPGWRRSQRFERAIGFGRNGRRIPEPQMSGGASGPGS